jgi:hypothetical protein
VGSGEREREAVGGHKNRWSLLKVFLLKQGRQWSITRRGSGITEEMTQGKKNPIVRKLEGAGERGGRIAEANILRLD